MSVPATTSDAIGIDVAALVAALDAETDALASGAPPPPPTTKLVLLATLESARAGAVDRDALEALSLAARRNQAALARRRDASRALLDDLHRRLAEAADDGTYSRAEVLGLVRAPDRALDRGTATERPA